MMKRINLYFPVLVALLALFTGCDKETTLLPPREISEEVQVIADRYNEILTSTDKWVLAYKPENYEDSVYIQLQFTEEGKVDILSGYRDFHTLQSATVYTFEGKYIPIITFADNTVFGTLADLYNGSAKFKINYIEDGEYFELVRSDGYDDEAFRLLKMNTVYEGKLTDQIDAVLAQIAYEEEQARLSAEVRQKVKDFVEMESDFYFYNLTVDDFSAAINSFDTTARTIALTYKETPTSAPTEVTVGYTLTPEGIVLNPAISYADVTVDVIALGDFKYEDPDNPTAATSIEIVSAGNAGAGVMGYVHEAPYPYTKVTDRSQTSVDWIIDEMYRTASTLPSAQWNLLYTNSTSLYSEKASAAVADFKTWLSQNVADYNPAGLATFNIQFHFLNNRVSFGILLPAPVGYKGYDVSYRKSSNHGSVMFMDIVSDRTGTHNPASVREGLETFMRTLFPEEGFTVVPVPSSPGSSSHRVHLVSRKDSRIWGEFRFQTASMYNIQHN